MMIILDNVKQMTRTVDLCDDCQKAVYEYIFEFDTVPRAYVISIVLTLVGVFCSLTITTMLGYALARQGLPFRGIITFLVFFTMLFNGGLVPTYINYSTVFNLKNTFFALLIPSLMMNARHTVMNQLQVIMFVIGAPLLFLPYKRFRSTMIVLNISS